MPGDRFLEEIKHQIELAKAVIVIWTESAVKSEWVLAEATLANARKKLVTVRDAGLDVHEIPLPFNTWHAELVRRGIEPSVLYMAAAARLSEVVLNYVRAWLEDPELAALSNKQCPSADQLLAPPKGVS